MNGLVKKLSLIVFTLSFVPSIGRAEDALPKLTGRYTVPVADDSLRAHATFEVEAAAMKVAEGAFRLEVSMPFELSGSTDHRQVFEGRASGRFITFESVPQTADGVKDTLQCSTASSQALAVCIARWDSLKGKFDEARLTAHLREKHPDITAADLAGKLKVSRAFGGDAIGVLDYTLPAPTPPPAY